MYPFPHNPNILLSAKWLQCHLVSEGESIFYFLFFIFISASLPSRVFLWRKHVTKVVLMTQALVVFLESSHNQFNLSDLKANVSFCLWQHQQFSKRFDFGCMRVARHSEDWVQTDSKELLWFFFYFHSLDGEWFWKTFHLLFLSIFIYKQGKLGELANVCKVML